MIQTYFNKPVAVQAIQWTGNNLSEIFDHLVSIKAEHAVQLTYSEFKEAVEAAGNSLLCLTPNGTIYASVGDFIVFQSADDFYPVKPEVFRNKYQTGTTGLCFSQALVHLKNGGRVARAGWNGKGMFIFKVNGSRFITNREPLLSILGEGTEVQYQTHYDMKTADGSIVPWLCSQSDMDAEDWEIV